MSSVPYPKIYRANAYSRVVCKGERKARTIRDYITLTEQLYNLPEESLDRYIRLAFVYEVSGKHTGEEVFYAKEHGYLIDGVEYWSEE